MKGNPCSQYRFFRYITDDQADRKNSTNIFHIRSLGERKQTKDADTRNWGNAIPSTVQDKVKKQNKGGQASRELQTSALKHSQLKIN